MLISILYVLFGHTVIQAGILVGLLVEEPEGRPVVSVALEADDGESLASAFGLASVLRAQGLAVEVAGAVRANGPRVTVSGGAFLVSGAGEEARRLASVEAVVQALREIDRD